MAVIPQASFHRLILKYFSKEIYTVMLILQLEKYWFCVCVRGRGRKKKRKKEKKCEKQARKRQQVCPRVGYKDSRYMFIVCACVLL